MKRLARALSLLVITMALAIGSLVAAPSLALAANQYPTAAEVYVSGGPMSEYTGNHASYDASTGTLTLTNQVMGVSVVSDRNIPLDLNIVVDGNVPVYGRTNLDWMHPRLVGIDNNTGSGSSRGNINITLTAGSKLSVNCVTLDETPAINRSLTEATGISCSGTVTLTGPEGSEYSVYVRSDWHENVDGQSTLMSVPNLATTGIKAGAGLNIEGAASGNIRIQNHGAAVTAYACSRAVEVFSGAKINVRSTGNWTFDTSSCFGSNVSAVFYIHAGKPQLVIAPATGVVTFKTCGKADIAKFMMNGDGTTWGTDTLPEVSGHVLEIGQSQTRYTKDSRAIISTTEIKLNELPALGTSGSITADNTVLDLGYSSPRYTMSNARWWYREPGSDVWRTLGVNQLLPANATAVRAGFSLEAASSYRFSYGTDVIVRFTNSAGTSTRHTTERAYMHPASDPSSGTFYVEFQLADLADQHPIETVKVWSVTAPYKGGQAYVNTSQSSSKAQIPSGSQAHYEWATSLEWGTRPGNQYWTEVDEYNNEIRTLTASDTFQAGHSYRWNGIISAKPGWEFTEDTVITLNNGNVFGFNIYADGKLLHVFRTWSVPTTNIKKVEVLNQTEPVAGEAPVIDGTVPDGAAYSITPGESYWYNGRLNASNSYQLNSLPHFTGTFVADQWYSYVVCIEPDRDNGYGFNNFSNETDLISSNVDVTINGVSLGGDVFGRYFTSGYTSGKGKIFVCRTFYCTNPDAVNRIEIQQTMPVAGTPPTKALVADTPLLPMAKAPPFSTRAYAFNVYVRSSPAGEFSNTGMSALGLIWSSSVIRLPIQRDVALAGTLEVSTPSPS